MDSNMKTFDPVINNEIALLIVPVSSDSGTPGQKQKGA